MNKQLKRIGTYAIMSLLYMILGFTVISIAGKPVISYVLSYGKMAIAKGAPVYLSEYDTEVPGLVLNKEGDFDKSEIQVPEPESQYASMECKRVELSAPIYYGDSDVIFQKGVGQYPGSGLPGEGKPIILGGHDGTFFAPLEQIIVNDIVEITTDYGRFEYKVVETRIADVSDTSTYDLTQATEQLILYTCYPFGQLIGDRSDRYYVYCERITDAGNSALEVDE